MKLMTCINTRDYYECLTYGSPYWVEIEDLGNGQKMYKFKDDNGEPLQSMMNRFIEYPLWANQVVQAIPEVDTFGNCFILVTEVCDWGIKGSITLPGMGTTYVRVLNGNFLPVGWARYISKEDG